MNTQKRFTPESLNEECERLDRAVASFAEVMRARLYYKASRGYYGWDDVNNIETIRNSLLRSAAKLSCGDPYQAGDVANLAMFLFYLYSKR